MWRHDSHARSVGVAVAIAVFAALALTGFLALAAPQRDMPVGAMRLSAVDERSSRFADVAVSPTGDRVVVVWGEEYTDTLADGETPPRFGSIRLRWTSGGTAGSWHGPVTVFTGSLEACASGARVAVTGTTAHVAYIVRRPCSVSLRSEVVYRPYSLGGELGESHLITFTEQPDALFSDVDVAVDGQGNPHFVYLYRWVEAQQEESRVFYRTLSGGVLGAQEQVSDGKAEHPVIAWDDGVVHAAWEDLTEVGALIYRRRVDGWEMETVDLAYNRGNENDRPRNPAIVARGGRVVVVWDWRWTGLSIPDQYALAYAMYLPEAGGWLRAREVGTDVNLRLYDPERTYTSTERIDRPSAHMWYLRPSVALDREGRPAVVWHVNQGPIDLGNLDYDVMFIRAQTVTVSGISWLTPTVLVPNSGVVIHAASAVVAMAPVSPTLAHVAYMYNGTQALGYGEWETYYVGVSDQEPPERPEKVFLPVVLHNYPSQT